MRKMGKFNTLTKKLTALALVLALLAAIIPLGMVSQVKASPATIYVPGNYPMVQAAVDAAK